MSAIPTLRDCRAPWEWLNVDASGNARCCCHSRGSIGNLQQQPFEELWNGPPMQRLREAMARDRFTAYCKGAACAFALNTQARIDAEGALLDLGEKVVFSSTGNFHDFALSGWAHAEAQFTWTDGPAALLKVCLAAPGARSLVFRAGAFVPQALAPMRVQVAANGQPVATLVLDGGAPREHRAALPPGMQGGVVVTFDIAHPCSPKDCGLSEDPRQLGLCLEWLAFLAE